MADAGQEQASAGTAGRRYARLAAYSGLSAVLPLWQQSCCAIVGLGGLGGGLALQLARFGVRRLILVDRDTVGQENLGHQQLFTEAHAAAGLPKVEAAAEVLRQVNSAVELELHSSELNRHTIRELLGGAELLFDGLDNYYSRLLLNDYAFASGKPYFYAGVVRGELSARAILPGYTGCLRCLVDTPPPPGSLPTCSTEGVFPPLLGLANLLQLELAGSWLTARGTAAAGTAQEGGTSAVPADILYSFEIETLRMRQTALTPRSDCPVCRAGLGQGRYDYLDGALDQLAASACASGRIELQLPGMLDLQLVARRLSAAGTFSLRVNAFCLIAQQAGLSYTLFPGGKLVLEGTEDPARLNHFVATFLGA